MNLIHIYKDSLNTSASNLIKFCGPLIGITIVSLPTPIQHDEAVFPLPLVVSQPTTIHSDTTATVAEVPHDTTAISTVAGHDATIVTTPIMSLPLHNSSCLPKL